MTTDLCGRDLSSDRPSRRGAGSKAFSRTRSTLSLEWASPQRGPRGDRRSFGRSTLRGKTPSLLRFCSTPSVRRPWLLRAARLRPEYGHGHPHASCIAHEPRSGAASSTLARCSLGSRSLLEGIFNSALVAALLAGGVLHLSRSLLESSTPLTLGVDDRIWPLQALGRARVAWTDRGGVEHAAMFVHEQELLADGELPFDVSSRAEGLPWVDPSQQWRARLIYSHHSESTLKTVHSVHLSTMNMRLTLKPTRSRAISLSITLKVE